MISFIQLGDYDVFLDPVVRAKKFNKFRTQTLILVMEKYFNSFTNNYRFHEEVSFFSSMSAEQKSRSKKIEAFISALKAKQNAITKQS